MAQKSQINIKENQYEVVKSELLGSAVKTIVAEHISNRSGLSSVREKFSVSGGGHAKNEIYFMLLSAADVKGQEGVSVDYLLLACNNNYTTRGQLEKYLDEIVKTGLFSYDEPNRNYKITKRGSYYLRSYAVTAMDLF